jgi:hypothetical protein
MKPTSKAVKAVPSLETSRPRTRAVSSSRQASFTVPTLTSDEGTKVAAALQNRLISLIDLTLTLKHIHWNVVGPNFIGVHNMLDPQHDGVQPLVCAISPGRLGRWHGKRWCQLRDWGGSGRRCQGDPTRLTGDQGQISVTQSHGSTTPTGLVVDGLMYRGRS